MRSRRLTLAGLALTGAAFLCTGPFPRTDGAAVTNEGYRVEILNPANPLPPGWHWEDRITTTFAGTTETHGLIYAPEIPGTTTTTLPIMEDDPRWDCRTMGNLICGPTTTAARTEIGTAVTLYRTAGESECPDGSWAPEGYC